MKIVQNVFAGIGVVALLLIARFVYVRLQPIPPVVEWRGTAFEQQVTSRSSQPAGGTSDEEGFKKMYQPPVISLHGDEAWIRHLGVAIPAKGLLKNLVYSWSPNDWGGEVYAVTTSDLIAAGGLGGSCLGDPARLGLLEIIEKGNGNYGPGELIELSDGRRLLWTTPQDVCGMPMQKILADSLAAFRAAVKQAHPIPPYLQLESVVAGDQYGAWTVASTSIALRSEKTADGVPYQAIGGQIFFKGSMSVHGRYEQNDLEGGVIFYPDKQYYREFPYIVEGKSSKNITLRDGVLRIGLFGGLSDGTKDGSGEATLQIIDPVFQKVSCTSCDPWQGLYISAPVPRIP